MMEKKPAGLLLLFFCLVVMAGISCARSSRGSEISWPTEGWQITKPADLDWKRLSDMLDEIEKTGLNLDSLVVVYQGRIVSEKYYPVYTKNTLHDTYSITKSVISALVGIALKQGCITDLNDPVLDYFPEREFLNLDEQKKSITIEHLLTMSSGLAYDHDEMLAQLDWVQYTLDQPVMHQPGEFWEYQEGGPQVLSALLGLACGMDAEEFADQYLFSPLNINNYHWQRSLGGYPNGSWGLKMTPRDLAKIGYLYLNEGLWEDKQILPSDWVARSTRSYFQVPDPLEPWEMYYGYLWWVHGDGPFAAHGYKGQFIYLIPEHDLVVIMGDIPDSDFVRPQLMIRDYIIPAVDSSIK